MAENKEWTKSLIGSVWNKITITSTTSLGKLMVKQNIKKNCRYQNLRYYIIFHYDSIHHLQPPFLMLTTTHRISNKAIISPKTSKIHIGIQFVLAFQEFCQTPFMQFFPFASNYQKLESFGSSTNCCILRKLSNTNNGYQYVMNRFHINT